MAWGVHTALDQWPIAHICKMTTKKVRSEHPTSHHQSSDTLSPALHGGLHQSREAVTVPPLNVETREVVEQVV